MRRKNPNNNELVSKQLSLFLSLLFSFHLGDERLISKQVCLLCLYAYLYLFLSLINYRITNKLHYYQVSCSNEKLSTIFFYIIRKPNLVQLAFFIHSFIHVYMYVYPISEQIENKWILRWYLILIISVSV